MFWPSVSHIGANVVSSCVSEPHRKIDLECAFERRRCAQVDGVGQDGIGNGINYGWNWEKEFDLRCEPDGYGYQRDDNEQSE